MIFTNPRLVVFLLKPSKISRDSQDKSQTPKVASKSPKPLTPTALSFVMDPTSRGWCSQDHPATEPLPMLACCPESFPSFLCSGVHVHPSDPAPWPCLLELSPETPFSTLDTALVLPAPDPSPLIAIQSCNFTKFTKLGVGIVKTDCVWEPRGWRRNILGRKEGRQGGRRSTLS